MKLAVVTAALSSMGALATPVASFSNYHLTDLEWTVEVSPGHTITVNGTLEDVARAAELAKFEAKGGPAGDAEGAAKRDTNFLAPGGSYYCGGPLEPADMVPLLYGQQYLRDIGEGAVKMSAGPGACGRVSCSLNSAVYLCNDNPEVFYLDSWSRVVDGLGFLMSHCAHWPGVGNFAKVSGQVFHPDNWNVMVRKNTC